MSKSLKNFITIQDALKRNSSRELRIFFLLHQWRETLDYSDSAMEEASNYEKTLREFFLNVKDLLRGGPASNTSADYYQKWGQEELELNGKLSELQDRVRVALSDNIDTKSSLEAVKNMITTCNKYLRQQKQSANRLLMKTIAEYVTQLFQIFGVIEGGQSLGFPSAGTGTSSNTEEAVMPALEALGQFRKEVRQEARKLNATRVLELCDQIRDDVLPELGVRLEDRGEDEPPSIKIESREALLKEREAKRQAEDAKKLEKEKKKAELAAKEAEKEAKRRVPPEQLFRSKLFYENFLF